jgi:hypothetical protein
MFQVKIGKIHPKVSESDLRIYHAMKINQLLMCDLRCSILDPATELTAEAVKSSYRLLTLEQFNKFNNGGVQ